MTNTDKENIDRLRSEGLGYKRIASALSLNPNTVKSYIRKTERDLKTPRCKQCGRPLLHQYRKTDCFCSAECRNRWWSLNRYHKKSDKVVEHVCQHCGATFLSAKRAGRKYCSRKCYMEERFHG